MIRNMMGTVSNFFNYSPKRQGVLDEKIAELCPESKVRKIKYEQGMMTNTLCNHFHFTMIIFVNSGGLKG